MQFKPKGLKQINIKIGWVCSHHISLIVAIIQGVTLLENSMYSGKGGGYNL